MHGYKVRKVRGISFWEIVNAEGIETGDGYVSREAALADLERVAAREAATAAMLKRASARRERDTGDLFTGEAFRQIPGQLSLG